MKYLITILISLVCLSCKNFESEKKETTSIKIKQYSKLIADDFPIPNDFLNTNTKIQYQGLFSPDTNWFTTSGKSQTIAITLYTDKHRLVTYLFINNDIPIDLIHRMEFLTNDGELAPNDLKEKLIDGFIKKAKIIDRKYFKSNKGFSLVDNLETAIQVYGKPHEQLSLEGVDKLHWKFEGDTFGLAGKENLVQDSFGHEVTMYFRNDQLIGMILYNAIP